MVEGRCSATRNVERVGLARMRARKRHTAQQEWSIVLMFVRETQRVYRGAPPVPMQNVLVAGDCQTHETVGAQVETSSSAGIARLHARAKAASLPEMKRRMRRHPVSAEVEPGWLHVLRGAPRMPMRNILAGPGCRRNEGLSVRIETSSGARL